MLPSEDPRTKRLAIVATVLAALLIVVTFLLDAARAGAL